MRRTRSTDSLRVTVRACHDLHVDSSPAGNHDASPATSDISVADKLRTLVRALARQAEQEAWKARDDIASTVEDRRHHDDNMSSSPRMASKRRRRSNTGSDNP